MAQQQPGGVPACILHEIGDAKAAPAYFTCTSGELLWGQLHTVIAGSTSAEVDTELSRQQRSDDDDGGTALARSFRFKVVARSGQWKVEAAFLDDSEGKPWHIGFVCHHIDVDGAEVLRRAAEAGLGGNGKFADLDVVFVDRYDWSGSQSPGCELIVQAVQGKELVTADEEDFEDEDYYRSLVQGRFMLIDTQGFSRLIEGLKDGKRLEQRNYIMGNGIHTGESSSFDSKLSSNFGDCFGMHLVVDHSEYDMGWMAFQDGKLVGFVYDGAYSALEGDNLRMGNSLATSQ